MNKKRDLKLRILELLFSLAALMVAILRISRKEVNNE